MVPYTGSSPHARVEACGRGRGGPVHRFIPACAGATKFRRGVRQTSRVVEAAKLALMADRKGFETVTLADWLGLDLDAQ